MPRVRDWKVCPLLGGCLNACMFYVVFQFVLRPMSFIERLSAFGRVCCWKLHCVYTYV